MDASYEPNLVLSTGVPKVNMTQNFLSRSLPLGPEGSRRETHQYTKCEKGRKACLYPMDKGRGGQFCMGRAGGG